VYIAIKFSQSAFKHGITEAAIRRVCLNAIYDDILDEDEDKHLLLGFDGNGNILEILYNVIRQFWFNQPLWGWQLEERFMHRYAAARNCTPPHAQLARLPRLKQCNAYKIWY
jgi:hypothetical protein